MRRVFAIVAVAVFVFCSICAMAEEKKAEPIDNAMEVVSTLGIGATEAVGFAIGTPIKAMIAGCVALNNAIYKDKKNCYYCATGEEHPTGIHPETK